MKRIWLVTTWVAVAALGCEKKIDPPAVVDIPKPTASAMPATAAPTASAAMPAGLKLAVSKVKGTFLIDAPLEKIKGQSEEGKGSLVVDVKDLTKSRGEVMVRLLTLSTTTFGDKSKDESQTEHARNWMEVGPDSPAAKKTEFEYAKFTITAVETATPKLADVKEEAGARIVKVKATGNFWLHGVTAPKTVMATVTFKGPPDAPTEVQLKTDEPLPVSMKEHGIMPRDKIGSFLDGALGKIGKKIDDKIQVSIDLVAR